ncbi:MAG TPA: dihydropteroate synthase [Gammaproteobacteria bacterium]|nr:dihydropteroate synthase [Gammaproteobacteria bacterium]
MGVINVTPDSFSDGGKFLDPGAAADQAARLVAEGAAILDVGAVSTRPGAQAVAPEEEQRRLLPALERIVAESKTPVSVDTSNAAIMRLAVEAGAAMINDQRALREPGALEAAAAADCAVCLMHMQGSPETMQYAPRYADVVKEVCTFLETRADACVDAGIAPDHILLDPGFGFGKSVEHNLRLLRHLPEFLDPGYPLLVGLSRKSSIGKITGAGPDERLAGSLAAATIAVWLGASIVRAHDVKATVEALAFTDAVRRSTTS